MSVVFIDATMLKPLVAIAYQQRPRIGVGQGRKVGSDSIGVGDMPAKLCNEAAILGAAVPPIELLHASPWNKRAHLSVHH